MSLVRQVFAVVRVHRVGRITCVPQTGPADSTTTIGAPDGPLAAFPAPGGPEGPLAAERVEVYGDVVEATLTAPRPGVAVVLEPWFPGWTATVDGKPAPIARADFAFMAVPVARGRHVLRLEFVATQLGRGVLVGASALALSLAALWWRRSSSGRTCPKAVGDDPVPRHKTGSI